MKKVLSIMAAAAIMLSMCVGYAEEATPELEEAAEIVTTADETEEAAVDTEEAVEEETTEEVTEEVAEEVTEEVSDEIVVKLDGEAIVFPDQKPVIINDRTMVPLRAIFEALGAVVSWDNDTNTAMAIKGDIYVFVQIDNDKLIKNDETVILDVPVMLINDRTMVPVRAISEAFECTVDWVEGDKEVLITSAKADETVVEEAAENTEADADADKEAVEETTEEVTDKDAETEEAAAEEETAKEETTEENATEEDAEKTTEEDTTEEVTEEEVTDEKAADEK